MNNLAILKHYFYWFQLAGTKAATPSLSQAARQAGGHLKLQGTFLQSPLNSN